jgi:uncharacterized SAM-binding protein YcdF (DUF218 family)
MSRPASRRRVFTWKRLAFLIFVLVILLIVIFHRMLLVGVADYLMVGGAPEKADLIAVLGGETERVVYGVKLYQEGYAPRISFTGDVEELLLFKTTFPEMARQYAESAGVDPGAILTARATSTYGEAQQIARWVHDEGFHTVLIVTSPYHLRRARWIFTREIHEVKLYFTAVPLSESRFRFPDWWRDEQSGIWVMEEYVKLAFYHLKYGF